MHPRLSRIFSNRVISRYKTFKDFYEWKKRLNRSSTYLKHAAQGLEVTQTDPFTYWALWVVVNHTLAEKLKHNAANADYVLTANGKRSPVNDHPFCLFDVNEDGEILQKEYGIENVIYAPSCHLGPLNACMSLVGTSVSLKS
nr:hypothetical protein [Vibrio sp. 03_296]